MSAFTPASEVLLRHSDDFEQSRILFAGDLQDDLPARLDTAASRAHTQQFHHWQVLSRQMVKFARRTVRTRVFVAETRRNLKIFVKPRNHQQLLKLLRRLRQGIKAPRIQP